MARTKSLHNDDSRGDASLSGLPASVAESNQTAAGSVEMVPDRETFLHQVQTGIANGPSLAGQIANLLGSLDAGSVGGREAAEQAIQLLQANRTLCLQFNSFLPEGCLIYDEDEGGFQVLAVGGADTASTSAASSPTAAKSSISASSSFPSSISQTPQPQLSTLIVQHTPNATTTTPTTTASANVSAANNAFADLPPVSLQEAELFLDYVRRRVSEAGQPHLYHRFKTYITEYLTGERRQREPERIAQRCLHLFRYYPDLLMGFSRFLPPQFRRQQFPLIMQLSGQSSVKDYSTINSTEEQRGA